jgi:hypothetical protein
MTVPSCEQHNNAISMDVEYTRNVLSTYFGTNTVGQQHFNDKALRSFDRSPALLYQTFGKMRPVKVQGMTIGAYPMEIERVENVMQSCVCALHFFRTGERKPNWNIVLASASHPSDAPDAIVQEWLQVLSLFRQISFALQPTNSPDVFEYAFAGIDGGCVYAMRFYRSFVVYGFTAVEAVPVSEGPF